MELDSRLALFAEVVDSGSFSAAARRLRATRASVARQIAQIEIPDDWSPQQQRMSTLRYAVLGTVMFEPVILALRRMAHVARAHMLEEKHRRATGAAPRTAPPSAPAPPPKPARSSDKKPRKGKRRR